MVVFLLLRSKLANFSTKCQSPWRIEALHGVIILALRIELIKRSVLIIHSNSCIFYRMIYPLVPIRPLSRIPSLCHSVSLYLLYCSQFCPRHNSSRRSLFMRVSRKEWPVPSAHRGIWHGAGATKSWLHSATLKKSFVLIEKASRQPKFSIQMIRETLRDDSETELETQNN